MIAQIKNIFISYSYLVLANNPVLGLVLFLLAMLNPSSGILSLIAYLAITVFGRFVGLSKEQLTKGMYSYNSILVGLSMGSLFEITPLSVLFTVIASCFTLLLSFTLQSIFGYYLRLPVLNVPFTTTATLVYLSSARYGNLYTVNTLKLSNFNIDWIPVWLSGLFKSTGLLMFLPYDVVGIAVLIAIFLYSRIHFFLCIAGYYTGTILLWFLKGSHYSAFSELNSFNFILIALAIGGLYLIPSLKSYLIAMVSVLISVFVLDAVDILWSSYGIPAFSFPFVIVVLMVLYVLIINKSGLVTDTFLNSPEHNLEHFLNYSSRFNIKLPQPQLPFTGEWTIYQSFNGEWTHKGIWAYAVDFNITDTEGKSYRNDGKSVEDYYCYSKPILSPVSGRVVEVWDECKDNPVGGLDEQNNWGNYIILLSDWGYYIELSHFQQGSILVKTGDYVVQGQHIGKCGNSGYSPQPHLHMQCQNLAYLGAPTIFFLFSNVVMGNECLFGTGYTLKTGTVFRPFIRSKLLERKMLFNLDELYLYEVCRNDRKSKSLMVNVKMMADGSYTLHSDDGAFLYFTNRDGVFSFYRYEGNPFSNLKYLFLALPRIPLTEERVVWEDDVNTALACKWGALLSFFKSFNHTIFKAKGRYKFTADLAVDGKISAKTLFGNYIIYTHAEFAERKGIRKVAIQTSTERIELNQRSV